MINCKITDIIDFRDKKIICEGFGDYEGVHIGGFRYILRINILKPKGNKKLACIMMNPSTTFPDEVWNQVNWIKNLKFTKKPKKTKGFDPTVKNVIKMAYSKGYSHINVFNLFPYIQPDSNIAFNFFQKEKEKNIEYIEKNLKNNSKLLIAWGNKSPQSKLLKKDYLKLKLEALEIFKKKNVEPVMYEWNVKKKCPYHPSQQVDNAYTKDKITGQVRKKYKGKQELGIIQQFINNAEDFKSLKIIDNGIDLQLKC